MVSYDGALQMLSIRGWQRQCWGHRSRWKGCRHVLVTAERDGTTRAGAQHSIPRVLFGWCHLQSDATVKSDLDSGSVLLLLLLLVLKQRIEVRYADLLEAALSTATDAAQSLAEGVRATKQDVVHNTQRVRAAPEVSENGRAVG